MISNRILSVLQSHFAKLLLIGFALVSISEIAAAQAPGIVNFGGTWEGTTTAGSQVFAHKWVIRQQDQDVVATITVSNQQNTALETYSMRGTVEGSRLSFEGGKSPNSTGCAAAGSLTYVATEDDTPTLSGEWHEKDVSQGCPAGTGGEIALKNRAIEDSVRMER